MFSKDNVTISGSPCFPVNDGYTNSRILCTSPAGTGYNKPVIVTAATQSSSPFSFAYDAPTISSFTTPNGLRLTSGNYLLTINGANLGGNCSVTQVDISGQTCTLIVWSFITSMYCTNWNW